MKGAINQAEELPAAKPGAWMPQQFTNPGNPEIHRRITAVEIWEDTVGKVDIFAAAAGTGGTLTGMSGILKSCKPDFLPAVVGPDAPSVTAQTMAGELMQPASHKIQCTRAGFVPRNLNLDIVDEVIRVTNDDAIRTARKLANGEGLLAGICTGANVWAARQRVSA